MKRLLAVLTMAITLPSGNADAAAWLQKKDDLSVSADWLSSEATDAKADPGIKINGPDYSKNDIQIRVEYGASDKTTVFVAPTYTSVTYKNGVTDSGVNDTQVGIRHLLWWKGNQVLSGEVSAFLPGAPAISAGGTDVEARLLYGKGFQFLGKPAFIDAELGLRMRGSGHANEARPDFTFGMQLDDKWQITASSLNVYSLGQGAASGEPNIEQHKVQVGASYSLDESLSLHGGLWTTIAGKNGPQESGATFGLSNKF